MKVTRIGATALCLLPLMGHAAISGVNTSDYRDLLTGPGNATSKTPTKRYIIKFSDTPAVALAQGDAAPALLRLGFKADAKVLRTLATGAVVVSGELDSTRDSKQLQATAVAAGEIEYIEEDRLLQHFAVPSDSRYPEQWHYFEANGGLNLPLAWDKSTGEGVTVAVLDTGYRPHVDLVNNILPGYDMISDTTIANDGNGRDSDASDPGDAARAGECGGGQPAQNQSSSWHGTHVAGTIAAESNNGIGVSGVAWNARILPLRVLGKCGGYTSDIADAIIWAAGGSVPGAPANSYPAKVINMSLGGGGSCDNTTQAAINTARSRGSSVIVAAGNSNANAANYSPASCSGVVTVAATNRSGGRAYYSNYGNVVEVAAPGGDVRSGASNGILSTLNAGTAGPAADSYAWYQGTSMAAPHVAGVAALLYALEPQLTPDQLLAALQSSARPFPASCSGCGVGIVDATSAITALTGGGGNTGGGFTENNLSAARNSWRYFTVEIPAGTSALTITTSGGSGDADLYVRRGSRPTTSSYNYRPYLNGNNETVTVTKPAAGVWHIGIRAYQAYSGVSLTVSY